MEFEHRHIEKNVEPIEKIIGSTTNELIDKTAPQDIRIDSLMLDTLTEDEYIKHISEIMDKNVLNKSFIGQGYYNTLLPNVIKRNILENPSWYTAYTPYQAEISQGRLESLINYQTMITSLTGMELANASMLDESTACAEAMVMLFNKQKGKNIGFFVGNVYPQILDVLKSRAEGFGIQIYTEQDNIVDTLFGCLIPYQDKTGKIVDIENNFNLPTIIHTDLLALTLLKEPSKLSKNIEVVVGSTQRLGLPMGYGGAHSAFFACKEIYKRMIPARIIGESVDSKGKKAYRMALQTREQHIKREKAVSNICTSQVLLANISTFYAIYHGSDGLRNIATKIYNYTKQLYEFCVTKDIECLSESFFDTLHFKTDYNNVNKMKTLLLKNGYNVNYINDNEFSISFDEQTTDEDLVKIKHIFSLVYRQKKYTIVLNDKYGINDSLKRKTDFLNYDVFNKYHTEHEILRYMKRLEKKDISLTDSMISLGSCTMKLNPTTAMIPLSWNSVGNIHPFVPKNQAKGYYELFENMNDIFKQITGFDSFSYQPNSGAQGEYAGLKVIKKYQESLGEDRNVVLIPSSAHGTNPATAKICGCDIVTIKCLENGNTDLEHLKEMCLEYKDNLLALMITYPSTHGVFEEDIKEICDTIHEYGGQVYMDGANLNAQVGLTNPSFIGADVCHMNLHKTFCIPHGGGGPGLGTIGVKKHLSKFLPQHYTSPSENGVYAISSTHYSSASILTISYGYIKMMGNSLINATKRAILNANYIKTILENAGYKILYKGVNDNVAHEMIVDFRPFKEYGIEVTDIAKRLIDYNFHAPTVSFPVVGTLMIEPTESETKEEMDRLCSALINIKKEIETIPSVLKNSPHTIEDLINWKYEYSIEEACYPLDWVKDRKYWSPVNRINDAYGDRNLFCTCS